MATTLRFVIAALWLALSPWATLAQTRIELAPPAALECLQVQAGEPTEPVYPFDEFKASKPGRVKANVTLSGRGGGNRVDILSTEGGEAFADAARRFLRALSAPCLKSDTTLAYDFVFQPDQRSVIWASPQENGRADRQRLSKCLRHVGGPDSRPDYPVAARRDNLQGRVYALLTFKSADEPPEAELLQRTSARVFAPSIGIWLEGLRLPCLEDGPVRLAVLFTFRLDDQGAYGFGSMGLVDLLSFSKDIKKRHIQLDTTTMGCPFRLKLQYLQPMRRNDVGEVGSSDPRRRPLLDLLAELQLDVRSNVADSIFADTADVSVPCVRINLNDPKEKSS